MVRAAFRLPRDAQIRTSVSKTISIFRGGARLALGADPGSGVRQIGTIFPQAEEGLVRGLRDSLVRFVRFPGNRREGSLRFTAIKDRDRFPAFDRGPLRSGFR